MPNPNDYPRVQFRAGRLQAPLAARGDNIAEVAQRDLERYYGLLAQARAKFDFTPGEASLIVDALNGTIFNEPIMPVWMEIADVEPSLYAKWDVDGPALVEKLRALSPAENLAVIDAAEQFWQTVAQGGGGNMTVTLAAVGLIR